MNEHDSDPKPETPLDPHQSAAEDLSQIAEEDELDLSSLGETFAEEDSADIDQDYDIVQDLQEQLATAKDQAMRALAEAENARKRAIKDRQDAGKFAIAGFARDLLEVADNLRRALDSAPEDLGENSAQIKNLIMGIEGTEKQLISSLEKNQIKQLTPMGETFDPNFHEVMFEAPDLEKAPGTVIQVMEVGYMLHDRLLRPARVGVVKDDGQGGNDAPTGRAPGDNLDQEI